MKIAKYTITGITPLLMHSERLANPFDSLTKELKAISGKRKKTEDDLLAMARIVFIGGLYHDDDAGIHVPGYNILATIGNTPHVRINRLFGAAANVWIKSERSNPGGSIKDRIALAMVEDAERSGALKPGGTIIEPTSGNTGIGLAMVAAVKGYKLVLVMPDSMSIERRRLMLAYGASFDLTPREKGMKGAIARAQELVAQTPGAWMPQQFENPANAEVHRLTTGEEIWADTDGQVARVGQSPARHRQDVGVPDPQRPRRVPAVDQVERPLVVAFGQVPTPFRRRNRDRHDPYDESDDADGVPPGAT